MKEKALEEQQKQHQNESVKKTLLATMRKGEIRISKANSDKNTGLLGKNGSDFVVGWISNTRLANWLVKLTVLKVKVNQYLATLYTWCPWKFDDDISELIK